MSDQRDDGSPSSSQGGGDGEFEASLLDNGHQVQHGYGDRPARAANDANDPHAVLVPMDVAGDSICAHEDIHGHPQKNPCAAILAALHKFFMMLPVVITMFLLTLLDVTFLIIEFSTRSEKYEYVTLFTSFAFFVELLIHLGHLGPKLFFRYDKYWMWAEAIIVSVSFFVEYAEFIIDHTMPYEKYHDYVAYMRAVRFLRVFILMKTRSRTVTAAVRRLVSADRRRFQQDGYDLDLTYVAPRVIAMSWPSESIEAFYRNHIDVVARFLDERHEGNYMVYNLCSERKYDETKFHNRVARYRLDDHNPGELGLLLRFGREVSEWMDADPTRVAVIHCKGGKGRTGTMVCTYLLYSGAFEDASSALRQFGEQRTSHNAKSFQGVESPSQARYVHYLDRLLRMPGQRAPERQVRLTKLVMYGVPKMYWDIGKLWFAVVTHPSTARTVHFVSNPTVTFSHQVPEFGKKTRSKTVQPVGLSDASASAAAAQGGLGGIEPFYGNMAISVRAKGQQPSAARLIDGPSFMDKYCPHGAQDAWAADTATQSRMWSPTENERDPVTQADFTGSSESDAQPDDAVVDVEFSTSSIAPFEGDTVLKFFHNVDDPNTLKCPVQIWFHPSMEQDALILGGGDVDGPHKDTKGKKYSKNFKVEIRLETVEGSGGAAGAPKS